MIDSEWRGADISNIIQWQLASIIDDHTSRVIKLNRPIVHPHSPHGSGPGPRYLRAGNQCTQIRLVVCKSRHSPDLWSIGENAGKREFHMSWQELGGPCVLAPNHSGFWLNDYRAHDRSFPAWLG